MIAIVDFRVGNLTSVKKAFDHLGAETIVTSDPARVASADKIVLPGVGHFLASSEEAPEISGLALWPGECSRFPAAVKSPHVGWNSLHIRKGSRLLQDVPSGSFVYFTHSYRVPLLTATSAECEYGGGFSAAIEQENMFGVQFHPEKSGTVGLKILENFCRL